MDNEQNAAVDQAPEAQAEGKPPIPSGFSALESPTPSKHKGLSKGAIIGIIAGIAVIVIALISAGIYIHSENEKRIAAEKAEQARVAAIESYNSYIDNMKTASMSILNGAGKCETAGNLMMSVWRSAIFDKNIDDWDEEARPYYSTDFNEALANMQGSDVYKGYVKSINDSEDTVDALMKKLKNPPSECEKSYDALLDLCTKFKSFATLVKSPSGSYMTANQSFRQYDSDLVSLFDKVNNMIPDKKSL